MSKAIHSAQTVALAASVVAKIPVSLEGDPGQGKTAKVTSMLRAWGRHPEVIVGSSREAPDFLGVPVEVNGFIEYVPFGWVKRVNEAKRGCVVLDEFNLAPDPTMRSMLRMIQEGYVGDTKLGDDVSIIAIMNPVESSAGGIDLMAPVSNRFIQLKWDFDADQWMDGLINGFENLEVPALADLIAPNAAEERIRLATIIAQFHTNTGSEHLVVKVPTDPVAAGKPWASPRSWTNALNAMANVPANNVDARRLILQGTVGDTITELFLTYLANIALPNPADVIANPNSFDWNSRADILFAVTRSIAAHVRLNVKADDTIWARGAEALAVCAAAGKPDVAHAALQRMMKTRPKGAILSENVIDEFRAILSYLPNGVVKETVAA